MAMIEALSAAAADKCIEDHDRSPAAASVAATEAPVAGIEALLAAAMEAFLALAGLTMVKVHQRLNLSSCIM
jgi:hypothetical protein